ncbi:hypothetical protein AAFF_G00416560 [Aldrovandia affinis]|uniref:Uncharacterized protein n=1 Tax=Aldrovandia affinis TaxID=143900 RepID=A0AAD7SAH3_9TELE|nr:hypothetical protein AAFF_G00416560 [Aldrovandia affinis]
MGAFRDSPFLRWGLCLRGGGRCATRWRLWPPPRARDPVGGSAGSGTQVHWHWHWREPSAQVQSQDTQSSQTPTCIFGRILSSASCGTPVASASLRELHPRARGNCEPKEQS